MYGWEKEIMVSIVVPVYNTAAYLSYCIDSLVSQTYSLKEIILVDDGSTDKSGEICDEYALRYSFIKVIHKENAGVSAARNTGIDMARGDYLVFIDSDDFVHPGLLEYYSKYLQGDCVPICRISDTVEDRLGESGNCSGEMVYTIDNFMEFFCDDYVNSPCNKVYSIDILRRHQIYFPENMSLGEDLIFNLRYLKYAPKTYRVSSEELYYYRQGSQESLSSRFRAELFELQPYMFEQLRIFLQDADVWTQENRGAYYRLFWNRLYLTLTIYMEQQRKVRTSELQEYIRAALNNPIWTEVWSACRREGIVTGKMRIKKAHVDLLKGSKGK